MYLKRNTSSVRQTHEKDCVFFVHRYKHIVRTSFGWSRVVSGQRYLHVGSKPRFELVKFSGKVISYCAICRNWRNQPNEFLAYTDIGACLHIWTKIREKVTVRKTLPLRIEICEKSICYSIQFNSKEIFRFQNLLLILFSSIFQF